jgi:putative transposase
MIRMLYADSGGVYGSPKIHQELLASGESCGRHKVARLMREAGLRGCPKKRYRAKGVSPAVAASNLLQQNFSARQTWVSDITFIPTRQGWLYLAAIMDLYSRRIVGWSMSRHINRHLALNALFMALGQRRPKTDLIHHSDRGAQYLSDDCQTVLKQHDIRCSLSGAGSCYDNAAIGSFFSLLKRERVNRVRYRTRFVSGLTTSVNGYAQSELSEGCDLYNQLSLDKVTSGIIGNHPFFAGEKIVASANNPSEGTPTTIEFIVDNNLVDSDGFPGSVQQRFSTDATFDVVLKVDSGGATWTIACFPPATAKAIPTITWQGIIMLMALLSGFAYYYHKRITV